MWWVLCWPWVTIPALVEERWPGQSAQMWGCIKMNQLWGQDTLVSLSILSEMVVGCPGERLMVTFLSGILGVPDGRIAQRLSSSEFWAWKYPLIPLLPSWVGGVCLSVQRPLRGQAPVCVSQCHSSARGVALGAWCSAPHISPRPAHFPDEQGPWPEHHGKCAGAAAGVGRGPVLSCGLETGLKMGPSWPSGAFQVHLGLGLNPPLSLACCVGLAK